MQTCTHTEKHAVELWANWLAVTAAVTGWNGCQCLLLRLYCDIIWPWRAPPVAPAMPWGLEDLPPDDAESPVDLPADESDVNCGAPDALEAPALEPLPGEEKRRAGEGAEYVIEMQLVGMSYKKNTDAIEQRLGNTPRCGDDDNGVSHVFGTCKVCV